MPWLKVAPAAALLLAAFVAVATSLPGGAPRADAAAGVAAVSAGSQHTCAVTTASGKLFCWGSNAYGQLGDGTLTNRETPTRVVGLQGTVTAVSAGGQHTCAITKAAGTVFCWGNNDSGQLGDGTLTNRKTPTEVVGLQDAVAVAAGERHTCAVAASATVMCWGDNSQRQLGDAQACGTTCKQPVAVVGLSTSAVAVAAGWVHSCALTMDGAVSCWGNNFHGQIGNNQIGNTLSTPAHVSLGDGAQLIAAGDWHTCAVTDGGAAKCWGENIHGQIGNGVSGVNQLVPASVVGLGSNVTGIAGGEQHSCAVTSGGAAKCWGSNAYGQLGDGSTIARLTPVEVLGLGGMAAVVAGSRHTCALSATASLSCWGDNTDGQLGDGTTSDSTTAGEVLVSASVGGIAELPKKAGAPVDPSATSDTIPRLPIGLAIAALALAFVLAGALLLAKRRRAA